MAIKKKSSSKTKSAKKVAGARKKVTLKEQPLENFLTKERRYLIASVNGSEFGLYVIENKYCYLNDDPKNKFNTGKIRVKSELVVKSEVF